MVYTKSVSKRFKKQFYGLNTSTNLKTSFIKPVWNFENRFFANRFKLVLLSVSLTGLNGYGLKTKPKFSYSKNRTLLDASPCFLCIYIFLHINESSAMTLNSIKAGMLVLKLVCKLGIAI